MRRKKKAIADCKLLTRMKLSTKEQSRLAVKPSHLFPIPSMSDAVRYLVERITTCELRQLVQDVLSLRKDFYAF